MRDSVLYFPHIEIADSQWLKASLLLWERVYRIVPESYAPVDGTDTRIALDADLVRAARLESADVREIAADFRAFLDSLPVLPSGLEDDETDLLHPEKVDATLYPLLDQYATGRQKGGWIELPREIVRGYMFFLSAKVADRRQLHRCTDDKQAYAVASYFSEDGNFTEYVYDREAIGFYSSLMFNDVLPVNLATVPMEHIVHVAKRSRDERTEFRRELERFTTELSACESKDHAETILNDHMRDLLKARDDLKASQGFLGEHDCGSLLTMGTPVALTAYGAFISGGADPFGVHTLGSSVLIGAMAAYQDFKKAKAAAANPYGASYLISLEREFAGTGRYPSFDRYFEEFVND
jgi:hypothetical protein